MTTESSTLVNLKELFDMEADRRVEEAVERERAQRDEAEREAVTRRAREQELEAARAMERQRAEAERAARDAELDTRIQRMKAELAEVRAQREEMRLAIGTTPAPEASSKGYLAMGMAGASLVAAALAVVVAWPQPAAPSPVTSAPTPVVEVAPPAPVAAAPEVTPEPVAASVVEEAPVVATREPRPQRPHVRTPRPRQARPDPHDLGRQLDLGGDESVLSDEFLDEADRGH